LLGQRPHRRQFALRHRAQDLPRTVAPEQLFDLLEGEPGAFAELDDLEPADRLRGVAALPLEALRLGQDADPLVVTDRRGVHAGLFGDFADCECRFVHVDVHRLELNLACGPSLRVEVGFNSYVKRMTNSLLLAA
jgi:hypothetical protein